MSNAKKNSTKTAFPLKWVPSKVKSTRKVNNQLARKPGEFYVKTVAERLDQVNHPNNQGLHDAIENYYKRGTTFSLKDLPKHAKAKLKHFLIDEDIQREADEVHVMHIVQGFDPRRVNPIFAVKFPGEDHYHCTDGQHTLISLAKLAQAGLIDEVDESEWEEMEVDVLYVETTDRSFAREHFAFINGVGKKKIDEYDNHKQRVLSYRLDGNTTNQEYALAAEKQTICEDNDVFPINKEDEENLGIPGTLTHLAAIKTMKPEILKFIVKNHNKFWKDEVVDSAEFSFNKHLYNKAQVPVDSPEFVQFMTDLNAIIKELFTNPGQLATTVGDAYSAYSKTVYGTSKSIHDTALLNIVLKIYQRLGGTYPVPDTVLSHTEAGHDLYNFLPTSVKDRVKLLGAKK
jgi:hypothetical protein